MTDEETREKLDAIESYLRRYGFTDVETNPPSIIPDADFYIIRATLPPKEYRFLCVKKAWLHEKPTPEEVMGPLRRKHVADVLKGERLPAYYIRSDSDMEWGEI